MTLVPGSSTVSPMTASPSRTTAPGSCSTCARTSRSSSGRDIEGLRSAETGRRSTPPA
ncbi:hypothetical protein ACI8AF_08765 [Blastococcus sp. SYSU D00669]